MLETFLSANSRDFRQRYAGSYGYYTVPESKKRVLVWMREIGEDRVEFMDQDQTRYVAHADTGVEFEFLPIEKRLFCVDDMLCLAQRKPARQFARGVNTQNTQFKNLATWGEVRMTFDTVKAACLPVTVDVSQSMKELEEHKRSTVVLSNLFGVYGTNFFLYDGLIGEVDTAKKQIKVAEPMFRQEVLDLVERLSLPYMVVANG